VDGLSNFILICEYRSKTVHGKLGYLVCKMSEDKDSIDSQEETDSMYKSFIEGSQQGVLIFQGDPPRICYANPAMTGISGYSNEELLSFTLEELRELTHPDDREIVFGKMDEFLKGNSKPLQYAYRAIRKNGGTYWAELTANIIQHGGKPAILVGFLDVSDIKEAEQRIAEERDRAQLYLDWAGVMFLALDPDGSIVLMNQKACEVLGCSLDAIVGQDWFDTFVPDRVRKDVRNNFDSLMSGEVISFRDRERSTLTIPGEERLISWYTTVLRDNNDAIIGLLSSGVDVTERRRVEEALLESEQKFRTLVEHLPVVTWTSDKDGNTVYISPNVEQIYGYTPEEIEQGGQDLWFGRIHPEDFERVRKEHESAIQEKRGFDIIYRIRRKDGEWIWIRDTSTRTYEEDGTFYASGMFTDITEKRLVELALEDSEEKYRTLVENMQDGVTIIQDGNIVFINSALLKILGYTTEELQGRPFLNLVAPESKPLVAERYRKRLEGEDIDQEYDIRVIKKDGTLPIIRIRGAIMEYQGKSATVATVTDITESKQAEDKLRLVQYSIDNASDPVFWVDKDGKFAFTNEAARNLLGYSLEEIEELTVWDIYPEFSTEQGPKMLAAIKEKGSDIVEISIKEKDGILHPVEVNVSHLIFEGRELFFSYVRDISERKQAEVALQISADELRATKDRALLYLDIMGHDIRNKLQGMMLATQIALLDIDEEDTKEPLATQEKSIETIQSLITRVNSLEEMSSEPLSQQDFVESVQSSIEILQKQYPHVKINQDIQIENAFIQADNFLGTLILNILDNAVGHNPSASPEIWIVFEEDTQGYNLSIRDNGLGISDSRKKELLDPNRRYGGIALHQSKFIVEKYGGNIKILDRVEGNPKEGACFCIWIPKSS